jgi:uncharacterized membrane protein
VRSGLSIPDNPVDNKFQALRTTGMASPRLRRFVWSALILLCVIGVAIVVRRTATLIPVVVHGDRSPALRANSALAQFGRVDDIFSSHPYLTLTHILPALLFVTLGPLQFSSTLRARHLQWHRWAGRVFVVAAAIVGVTAFLMSFAMPAIGGIPQAAATAIFSLYFLFSLATAFGYIRRHEISLHRRWMLRAFSTGIAVATIRPIVGLLVGVTIATQGPAALNLHLIFGTAFWIGFLLHAVITELWIRSTPVRSAA